MIQNGPALKKSKDNGESVILYNVHAYLKAIFVELALCRKIFVDDHS